VTAATFDPVAYWRTRGKVYERDFRPERYVTQELELEELLRSLQFTSVLDVGCGFGRIGEMVMRLRPDARYVGVDVSEDQLAAARRRVPAGDFRVADIRSMDVHGADLVLAIEVLMHVPPPDVAGVVTGLKRLAGRHLVTLDWSRPIGRVVKAPDFLHDYRALIGPAAAETRLGAQSIWYLGR
jgi:SAM-dependent methyltransferase